MIYEFAAENLANQSPKGVQPATPQNYSYIKGTWALACVSYTTRRERRPVFLEFIQRKISLYEADRYLHENFRFYGSLPRQLELDIARSGDRGAHESNMIKPFTQCRQNPQIECKVITSGLCDEQLSEEEKREQIVSSSLSESCLNDL